MVSCLRGEKMSIVKRVLPILISSLICSIIFVGCQNKNPEIITEITLNNISEEEYSKINDSNKPKDTSLKNMKKLYIDVKIINSKKAIERTIIIPDLFRTIDLYDGMRSTGGGSSEQNNIGTEDTAESTSFITFDARNLSEHEIRSIYSKSEIYIAYKLKTGEFVERRISIGDSMEINK
jgi:hypothetical protein